VAYERRNPTEVYPAVSGSTALLDFLFHPSPTGASPIPERITVRGSIVGTRQDLEEALDFAARGCVKSCIETQPLEAVGQVFERLKGGDVQGRVVLTF
jgi:D-arabinose 1-dehydrogenase-like Zn-dependent alcohol dehydrogenase